MTTKERLEEVRLFMDSGVLDKEHDRFTLLSMLPTIEEIFKERGTMKDTELTTIARTLVETVIPDESIAVFYEAILSGNLNERMMVLGVLSKYMDTLEDVVIRLCDALDG